MAENPWAWRSGENPYRRTPFQVLGLEVNLRGHGAIQAHIRARRRRIQGNPERFRVFGEMLDEARVNASERLIDHPGGRLYAELCMHRPPVAADEEDVAARLEETTTLVKKIRVPVPHPEVQIEARRLVRFLEPPAPRDFRPLLDW